MAKVVDCGLDVSEFELQSHYHIHFWINTPLFFELWDNCYSSTRMDLALNNPRKLI